MKNSLYPKLAMTNLHKNGKFYIPYIITCIISIVMLYQMDSILEMVRKSKVAGVTALTQIMFFGVIVLTIFSFIMLFYTNSFLMKQRKKELGLYNILGMGKRHISAVMIIESIYVFVIAVAFGLGIGILFSKLVMASLMKLLKFEIPYKFSVCHHSVLITLAIFGGIFILTTIYNITKVQLSKPIELLHGSNVGEKEPKTKYLLTIIGVLTLGAGYYLAITTDNPVEAIGVFFIAVVLVIVGTYCLFTSGSIALLKGLRKNKNYYYKTKNFVSVSNMIHRMKQNAVGLANICILSTMILVMISTTVSLYFGLEDSLNTTFNRNVKIELNIDDENQIQKTLKDINSEIKKSGVTPKNELSYKSINAYMSKDGNNFTTVTESNFSNSVEVIVISLDNYNKIHNIHETLDGNEAILFTTSKKFENSSIKLNGKELNIKKKVDKMDVSYNPVFSNYCLVLKDDNTINSIFKTSENTIDKCFVRSQMYGFDMDKGKKQINLQDKIGNILDANKVSGRATCVEQMRQDFLSLYGGLFFLGIYLGIIFLVATVLIMYYKQISEGYNDKERFEIMKKVGMEKKEIKKIIHSQVLITFFMPLVTAAIHVAFAFNIIRRMLLVFGMTNTTLFIVCTLVTVLVFAVFYAIVYLLTAKTYYKIVE